MATVFATIVLMPVISKVIIAGMDREINIGMVREKAVDRENVARNNSSWSNSAIKSRLALSEKSSLDRG